MHDTKTMSNYYNGITVVCAALSRLPHVVSVTTTQLCPCSMKAHRQSVNTAVWMCSNKTLPVDTET